MNLSLITKATFLVPCQPIMHWQFSPLQSRHQMGKGGKKLCFSLANSFVLKTLGVWGFLSCLMVSACCITKGKTVNSTKSIRLTEFKMEP